MIREKHLRPGRVIALEVFKRPSGEGVWSAGLVVSRHVTRVKRRHAKQRAQHLYWTVTVVWFGDRYSGRRTLEEVTIYPHQDCWKLLF